jgi:hypothetical protein
MRRRSPQFDFVAAAVGAVGMRLADCRRLWMKSLLLMLIFLLPGMALAQDAFQKQLPASPPGVATGVGPKPELLKVFNRPILVLRAALYGATPSDRVLAIEGRVSDLIARGKTRNLTLRSMAEGTAIELDGNLVMLVTPGDVDPFSGDTLEQTVERTVNRLQLAMNSMQEQRSVAYLMRAAGVALVATVLYLAFLWAAHRLQILLWTLVGRGRKVITKTLGIPERRCCPNCRWSINGSFASLSGSWCWL